MQTGEQMRVTAILARSFIRVVPYRKNVEPAHARGAVDQL
jgi:hypothetical protein